MHSRSLFALLAHGLIAFNTNTLAADRADTETPTVQPLIEVHATPDSGPRSGTGAKTDTPILEIPQSVSVVNRERMDTLQAQGVPQALRYTAGVLAENWGVDPRFDQYMLRGFDTGPGGLFRDGLTLPTQGFTAFTLEPYALERLDVLRGPVSTLYGQNEAGGMINAVTKVPPTAPLHEVRAGVGSFDRRQVAADFGGPLDTAGHWRYRLTALKRDAGSQTDFARDNRLFVAPALTWQPDAATSLTLLAHRQQDQRGAGNYLPLAGTRDPGPFGRIPAHRFNGEPGHDRFHSDQASIGYLFEHRLTPQWTLRQNLRQASVKVDYRSVYPTAVAADSRTVERTNFEVDQRADVFAVDNQAQWKTGRGRLENTLLFGLDYSRSVLDGTMRIGEAAPLDVLAPVYAQPLPPAEPYEDMRSSATQLGVYAQNQLKLDQRWVITTGLRRDRSRTENHDRLARASNRQDDQATTGRIGVNWLGPWGLAPYASYANSFKPVAGNDAGGRAFVPERSRQYELGIKWQPDHRGSLVTLAAFDLTKRNALTADPDSDVPGAQVQQGAVRVRGLELEGAAELGRGWRLSGAYTLLDAEITSNNDGNQGNRPSQVPRTNLSLWLERAFASRWRAGVGVRRIGSAFGDDGNSVDIPGVTLLDAHLGYRNGPWQVSLNASNLADKAYVGNCTTDALCNYGARRTALLSVQYGW